MAWYYRKYQNELFLGNTPLKYLDTKNIFSIVLVQIKSELIHIKHFIIAHHYSITPTLCS